MMEWKEVLFEDIIEEISMGPFGSDIKRDCYCEEGLPYLNGSNVQNFKLGEESFIYVPWEKAEKLKKSVAHRGDVIITHRGTLGQVVYIPTDSIYPKYLISNSQFRVKFDSSKVRADYITYYLHTRDGNHKIMANASQVGVPALGRPTTTFKQIKAPIPPLEYQNRVMDILSSLDKKIETNNKINANLEEMAQAIFKNWFVDFAPFKDGKFVESELGMIPEGWRVGTLSEVADIIMGQSPKGETLNEDGEGTIFYQGCSDFTFRYPKIRVFTTAPSRFAEANSTLFSVRAPVGAINRAKVRCCIGRGIASIKAHNDLDSYIYYLMLSLKNTFANYNGEGTVFGSINRKSLEEIKVVIPEIEFALHINKVFKAIDRRIESLEEENQHLASIRDTLLPRLMSGEIEV